MKNAPFQSQINGQTQKTQDTENILDIDRFMGKVQEFMNSPNSFLPVGNTLLDIFRVIEKSPRGFNRFFELEIGKQFIEFLFQVLKSSPSDEKQILIFNLLLPIFGIMSSNLSNIISDNRIALLFQFLVPFSTPQVLISLFPLLSFLFIHSSIHFESVVANSLQFFQVFLQPKNPNLLNLKLLYESSSFLHLLFIYLFHLSLPIIEPSKSISDQIRIITNIYFQIAFSNSFINPTILHPPPQITKTQENSMQNQFHPMSHFEVQNTTSQNIQNDQLNFQKKYYWSSIHISI